MDSINIRNKYHENILFLFDFVYYSNMNIFIITESPAAAKKKKDFDIHEEEKTYTITNRGSKSFKGNVIKETTFSVKFDEKWNGLKVKNLTKDLENMFYDILDEGKKDFENQDVARIYINHPRLNHAIIVKPRSLSDMSPKVIMDSIQNVVQSEEGLCIDQEFTVELGVVRMDKGAGRRYITDTIKDIRAKKSIVQIKNDDNLCLARSIAVCLARCEKEESSNAPEKSKRYALMRNSNRSLQKDTALQYQIQAQIPTDRACTLSDIPSFERALDIQVVVYAAHLGNKVIYQGDDKQRRIYLYYQQDIEHFDSVTNIQGLLNVSYFCHKCLKGYTRKSQHSCTVTCRVCRSNDCEESSPRTCNNCNMTCRSSQCFERHEDYCQLYWRCPKCKMVLDLKKRSKDQHRCGEWECTTCKQFQVGDHNCYLRIREPKQPIKKFTIVKVNL